MPGLAEHQRVMLALLKDRPLPAPDAYAAQLMPTKELALLREIAVWWRVLTIETACPSIARLLKSLGIFETSVESFCRDENVSPYLELASECFLRRMESHDDPLVRTMVEFEFALMRLRRGEAGPFAIDWDRDPEALFAALNSGAPLPEAEAGAGAVHRLHLTQDGVDYERIEVS